MQASNTAPIPTHVRYGDLARFFVPLALQSASQGLTYPLVAMVASSGTGGSINLAGLAQSNSIMFLIGTISGGIITTGMVFAASRESYRSFFRFNLLLSLIAVFIQAVICMPPVAHLVFAHIIGLPPSIEAPARITLLAALPLHFLFFMRNPFQVLLYNHRQSGRAGLATAGRVVLTLVLSPLFISAGLTGPVWAVICLTIPVGVEAIVSYGMARRFIGMLRAGDDVPLLKMWAFTLPLSAGGFLLTLTGPLLGSFIARAAHPEIMLPVYYAVAGLANPVSFGMGRIQTLVLSTHASADNDGRIFRFAVLAGLLGAVLPVCFILPGTAEWYYTGLQRIPASSPPLVRQTAVIMFFNATIMGLRSFFEGTAARARKPAAILAGQTAFIVLVTAAGMCALAAGMSGNIIGPVCIILSGIGSAAVTRFAARLRWKRTLVTLRALFSSDSERT